MPFIRLTNQRINSPIEFANIIIQIFNANTIEQTIAQHILQYLGANKMLIMIVLASL